MLPHKPSHPPQKIGFSQLLHLKISEKIDVSKHGQKEDYQSSNCNPHPVIVRLLTLENNFFWNWIWASCSAPGPDTTLLLNLFLHRRSSKLNVIVNLFWFSSLNNIIFWFILRVGNHSSTRSFLLCFLLTVL